MANSLKRSVRTSVMLTGDQNARLVEIATKSDVSLAWVIRHSVQQFLDEHENEQFPLPLSLEDHNSVSDS